MTGDAPRIHFEDRAAWRAWLLANHAGAASVWLVTWKKASGRPILSYDDAVSEAAPTSGPARAAPSVRPVTKTG